MTSKVTGQSGQAQVKAGKVKKSKSQEKKPIDIAKEMKKFADENNAAIEKDGFKALLKQVNKNNVVDIIKKYDTISSMSIVGMILNETGSDDENMEDVLLGKGDGKTAIRGIFTLLCDRARDVGVDEKTIKDFEKAFNTELDIQLGKNSFVGQVRSLFHTDSTKLATIMRALVQTIDNQTGLTAKDR